jgi:hypothetical protein
MVNYNNGKIYKIEAINGEEGDIYIGSTTRDLLSQRMSKHHSSYKYWLNNKTKTKTTSYILFEKYGLENCRIVLIENVNAMSKDELLSREAFYIKSMSCVNKYIPMRSQKEYQENNREKINENNKKYDENNKEKISENKKNYHKNNKEKRLEYYENNKEIMSEKRKLYYEKNKEKMKKYCENNKEKIKLQKELYCENNKEKIKLQKELSREKNKEKTSLQKKLYYKKKKDIINSSR